MNIATWSHRVHLALEAAPKLTGIPDFMKEVLIHSERVQVPLWDLHRPQSHETVTPLRHKYVPYTYIDPLGMT